MSAGIEIIAVHGSGDGVEANFLFKLEGQG